VEIPDALSPAQSPCAGRRWQYRRLRGARDQGARRPSNNEEGRFFRAKTKLSCRDAVGHRSDEQLVRRRTVTRRAQRRACLVALMAGVAPKRKLPLGGLAQVRWGWERSSLPNPSVRLTPRSDVASFQVQGFWIPFSKALLAWIQVAEEPPQRCRSQGRLIVRTMRRTVAEQA
jgi:hypothetical protein